MEPKIICWPARFSWLELPILDIEYNGAETIRFTIASSAYEMPAADAVEFARRILGATSKSSVW